MEQFLSFTVVTSECCCTALILKSVVDLNLNLDLAKQRRQELGAEVFGRCDCALSSSAVSFGLEIWM